MTNPVLQQIDLQRDAALQRLKAFLCIPSVSTDPAFKNDIERAAQWTAQALRDAGLEVKIFPTAGHPVVVGRSDAAGPDKPRAVYYGHYDVQPADPLDLWTSGPFEPTLRDGYVLARGASDDKGQVMCFIEAIAAWRRAGVPLPVNVTVVIEGEEESGSSNFHDFLVQHQAALGPLRPGIVLVSDTTMWDAQTVAITYGLRGLLYFDVQLHNANRDTHSGMFGGTFANPATILTQVLGKLHDAQHRVTLPGFYDDVQPLDPAERAEWAALHFDEFTHCLKPIGVKQPFGEPGFSTLERKWVRPTCDINGLYGGYGGAGAKTVIPSFAGAKVSFRLAVAQDPDKIAAAFERWLEAHEVHGCRWQVSNLGGSHAVVVPRSSPYVSAAARAVTQASGRPPVLVREGASIPVVGDFKNLLGLDTLLIGFGGGDDRVHAPNERFALSSFALGCRTHALLLAELAQI